MSNYYLYVHILPNNKKYFGITANISNRWRIDGKGYKHQCLFYRAIQKYGWDNIQHIILAENLSKEWACQLEQLYIAQYQTTNPEFGYNATTPWNKGLTKEDERVARYVRKKRRISSYRGNKTTIKHIP